jgi:predicted nucleotidyltransferase
MEKNAFKIHSTLNPNLWNDEQELEEIVRERLLRIARKFVAKTKLPAKSIKDVILTGSSANFNWSKYSDVDVHIIVDFDQIDSDKEFAKNLLDDEKKLWNLEHTITIYDYPVEIYVQDASENLVASGVFSLLTNKWIKKPLREKVVIDMRDIRRKADAFKKQIDALGQDPQESTAKKLKEKLGQFRQCGLDKEGEYSSENLVYKLLRRDGYLQKLMDIKLEAFDEELSLD